MKKLLAIASVSAPVTSLPESPISPTHRALIGFGCAFADLLVNYPIVTAKTHAAVGGSLWNLLKEAPTFAARTKIAYSGMWVTLLGYGPSLSFTHAVEARLAHLGMPKEHRSIMSGLVSGACLTGWSETLMVQYQLAAAKNEPCTLFGMTRKIVQQHGVTRLFRGISPLLMREIGFSYMIFAEEGLDHQKKGVAQTIFSKLMLPAATAFATNPFDVTKTNMQENIGGKTTTLQTARQIVQAHGWKRLWAGAPHRAVSYILCAGVVGAVRPPIQNFLNRWE